MAVGPAAGDSTSFEHIGLGGGVNLHLRRTGRFKSVLVEAVISEDLSDEASMTALLPAVLRRGTAAFADLQEIARHLDNLYGASFSADVMKVGERLMPYFRIDFPTPALAGADGDLLGDCVDFLAEVMFRPRLEGGVFLKEFVEGEKTNLVSQIKGLVTDQDHYTAQKCIEMMCRGERFAQYEYGTVEDAEAITPESLHAYYSRLLETRPVDVYVVGDVDPESLSRLMRKSFPERKYSPVPLRETEFIAAPSYEKTFYEEMQIEQARLAIGFRTGVRYNDPALPALLFFNGIFGGFAFSKLFKTVREKEGLAYFAGSQIERSKGIMLATTGIDASSFGRVMDLVRGILDSMRAGEVSREEMDSARARLMSRFNSISDSQTAVINMHLEGMVNGSFMEIGELLESIGKVSAEDVAGVARGVRLDTAYLLRPARKAGGGGGAA